MMEAPQKPSHNRNRTAREAVKKIVRKALRISRYSIISLTTVLFLTVLVAWAYGLKFPAGFSWSDRGFSAHFWAPRDGGWLIATRLEHGWLCAVLRAHKQKKWLHNWKRSGENAQKSDGLGRSGDHCTYANYLGWRMPMPGQWMWRFETKVEIAESVFSGNSSKSTEFFQVANRDERQRPQTISEVWLSPGITKKHIEIGVSVPFWVLATITGAWPTLYMIRAIARRRRRFRGENRCSKCGYDLTGNTSGICPECGTTIGKPATS